MLISIVCFVDILMVVLAGAVAHLTRFAHLDMTAPELVTTACLVVFSINSLQLFGFYRSDALFRVVPATVRLAMAWSMAVLGVIALGFITKSSGDVSRLWIGLWFIFGMVGLFFGRYALEAVARRLQSVGYLLRNTAVAGTGTDSVRIATQLRQRSPANGIRVIGLLSDGAGEAPAAVDDLPVLGTASDLHERLRSLPLDQVLIPLPLASHMSLSDWVAELASLPLDVRLCPDLSGWDLRCRRVGELNGLPFLDVVEKPITGWQWVAKTVEDRILAAVILIVILPVMLAIALAIKLDSRGPVFFRQKRFGINNELIEVLKFRSMHHGSVASDDPALQVKRVDPRVTRVGQILRRTSLDELPQFINVLKGDMSIVGPRPHAVQHNELYARIIDGYNGRHRVKPGITGWAQIHGLRGGIETIDRIEERVRFDLYYIDNWSLVLDLWIVLRTLKVGFIHDNAY